MTQPSLLDLPPTVDPAPTPAQRERKRLTAGAFRVLAFLQSHEFATSGDLVPPDVGGLGYSGRIHELKKDGWNIERQNIGGGIWKYTLKGHR